MVNKIEALRESFEIVAGDAEFQMQYLKRISQFDENLLHLKQCRDDEIALNLVADEVALQLVDDHEYIMQYLEKENLASDDLLVSYRSLSEKLIRLLNPYSEQFWTMDALVNDLRWIEIRNMAKLCLSLIPDSIPNDTSSLVE